MSSLVSHLQRRLRRMLLLASALFTCSGHGLAAPEADAQGQVERAPFHFASSAGCGDTSVFLRAFEARSSSLELVPGPENSPIQIELRPEGEHTEALLTIRLEDGRVVERSLEALSCEEALEAIAFVTALALRPEDVRPERAHEVPREEPSSDGGAGAIELPVRPGLEQRAPRSVWSLGVLGSGAMGPSPTFLAGAEAEIGFRPAGGAGPALRLGLGFWSTSTSAQREGTAHFERRVVSLDLCPLRADSSILTLWFCAQGAAGMVTAEGTETYQPERSVRPWVELGWALWPEVALGSRVSWTTRLAAGIPLYRDTYLFDDRTFYEVPRVVGSLSSGFNVRFP